MTHIGTTLAHTIFLATLRQGAQTRRKPTEKGIMKKSKNKPRQHKKAAH